MSLRDQYPEAFARAMAEADEDMFEPDNELPSSYLRQSLLEGLRKFDPAGAMTPMLDIRLVGQAFNEAQVNAVAADILIRLQNEINAAAPADAPSDSLEIGVGQLSRGSLVMHVRPSAPAVSEDELSFPTPAPLEAALRRILDLHDALETDPDRLPSRTRDDRDLHDRLRQLVRSLDEADAELEMDLFQSDGRPRRSRVTEQGRMNARALFARRAVTSVIVVSGQVEHLSGSGKVGIVDGRSKPEIEGVPTDIVRTLLIGSMFRARVSYERSEDAFGERTNESWHFIEMVPFEQFLTFPEG